MRLHPNSMLYLVDLSEPFVSAVNKGWKWIKPYTTDPVVNAVDNCWQRFKPYTEGLLAQAVRCLAYEAVGSLAGSIGGKAVLGPVCRELIGKTTLYSVKMGIAPLVSTALYLKTTTKTIRLASLVLIVSSTSAGVYCYLSSSDLLLERSADVGLMAGEFTGEFLGMVLGGIAGLWLAGGMEKREEIEDYSKGMVRFFLMGKSLEGVTFNYSFPLFNLAGKVVCVFSKTIAYNGPVVMSIVQRMIKGGVPPGALLPLAIRVSTTFAFKNFSDGSSSFIANRLDVLLPAKLFPDFLKRMLEHLQPSIPTWVNFGADLASYQAEVLTQKMMNSFIEYVKELELSEDVKKASQDWYEAFLDSRHVDLEKLEKMIVSHIFRESTLAHQAGKYLDAHAAYKEASQNLADSLLKSIREKERLVIGKELLYAEQVAPLSAFIALHVRSYIIFTGYNYKEFPPILNKPEELLFLKQLQETCVGPYLALSLYSPCAQVLSGGLGITLKAFYAFAKLIQDLKDPEHIEEGQGGMLVTQVNGYFPSVKKEKKKFDWDLVDDDENEKKS